MRCHRNSGEKVIADVFADIAYKYENWCAELKDPRTAHIFKIILHDNERYLW